MFAPISTRSAGSGRRSTASWPRRVRTVATVAALGLLTQACSNAPRSPYTGSDPSDPAVPVPSTGYRSTVAPFTSRRPVEPRPWLDQNERVAPASKSDHSEH